MSTRLSADDSALAVGFKSLVTFRDVAKLLEVDSKTLAYYLRRSNNCKVFRLLKQSGG
jgi:phage antirepressor YoqD-like protein